MSNAPDTIPAKPTDQAPALPAPSSRTASSAKMQATAVACVTAVIGMTALSFAAVPLYRLFCQVTGFAGTPQIGTGPSSTTADRAVTVRFDANVAPGMPWEFTAEQPQITAKLGETKTVFYKITNTSKRPSTGIATFNVTPDQAGAYFVKIQCFCFNEQTLQPGESIDAPVVFYVDPAISTNRDLKSLTAITLSYTVFPSKGGSPVAATAGAADKPKL